MNKSLLILIALVLATCAVVADAKRPPFDKVFENLSAEQKSLLKEKLNELKELKLNREEFEKQLEAFATSNGIDLSALKNASQKPHRGSDINLTTEQKNTLRTKFEQLRMKNLSRSEIMEEMEEFAQENNINLGQQRPPRRNEDDEQSGDHDEDDEEESRRPQRGGNKNGGRGPRKSQNNEDDSEESQDVRQHESKRGGRNNNNNNRSGNRRGGNNDHDDEEEESEDARPPRGGRNNGRNQQRGGNRDEEDDQEEDRPQRGGKNQKGNHKNNSNSNNNNNNNNNGRQIGGHERPGSRNNRSFEEGDD